MLSFGALAFLSPWLLTALIALPVLYYLLRATPPSPSRLAFPGVRLLLGLEDPEKTPYRTPWWLLLLRLLIAAAIILAFAQPVLNPKPKLAGTGPLLLIVDGGWASAPDWPARREAALAELDRADRASRPVAFVNLARLGDGEISLERRAAGDWRGAVEALRPAPWAPDRARFRAALAEIEELPDFETVWLTDGLAHGGDDLAAALAARGATRMIGPARTARALAPPRLEGGVLKADALRASGAGGETARIGVYGRAEDGGERRLATVEAAFADDDKTAAAEIDLPLELRNRISRLALIAGTSAGAAVLADDSVRRRRAAIVTSETGTDGRRLVSGLHYLRTALAKQAELVEGQLLEVLDANPDAIFLIDVGAFTEAERAALTDWVEAGGLLARFAGPRLARGADEISRAAAPGAENPLLPVDLRAGGRAVGGAMAWSAPQKIREFRSESPFHGLDAPRDVEVRRQILARMGPDVAERTWAALEDGTPLVTAAPLGAGRVALFHVTANAEWSSLPLSGLFVRMLERLLNMSGGGFAETAAAEGETLSPVALLDGFGRARAAPGEAAGVPARRLEAPPGPDAPPGLYAGETARLAYNVMSRGAELSAAPAPPGSVTTASLGGGAERPLAVWLLALAVALFMIDLLAALWISGRRPRMRGLTAALALLAGLAVAPAADAQEKTDIERALAATTETVLAHVITGDAEADRMAEAGLRGLSRVLTSRTAIEPASPIGVDLETDVLAFYPLLYWPITENQPTPSDEAVAKLNAYMRAGGMIVFDTRDAHLAAGAGSGPNTRALRRLTNGLDLPPLEPVDADHVITRTFYLLDRFPGRWTGAQVWVEATPEDEAEEDAGPGGFRGANDGVSPVVLGAADWAAAWAVGEDGEFLAPVGRSSNYRQREMAFRFGVNLAMYAMTGNYKSDQVHVPALLERLGQ